MARTTAALTQSHLQALLQLLPDAVFFTDTQGRITACNESAERIFGMTAVQIVGKPLCTTLFQGEDALRQPADLADRTLPAGAWIRLPARRYDGKTFTCDCQISPAGPKPADGHILLLRDVTEELLTEQQLLQTQKMEALSQLSGGLAHDFNNILGIIIGSLGVVAQNVGDREERELVNASLNAAQRGVEIARSLLAVARRRPIKPQRTQVSTLIEEMAPLLRQTAGKWVEIDFSPDTRDAACLLDPGALNNALINLVLNARDAAPPQGGRILVYAYQTDILPRSLTAPLELKAGSYIVIGVDDNGAGMAPEIALRAFDPFFTTKERTRSTGLGLSMVYAFARQTGGTARIQSAPGMGTSVQIILPIAPNADS